MKKNINDRGMDETPKKVDIGLLKKGLENGIKNSQALHPECPIEPFQTADAEDLLYGQIVLNRLTIQVMILQNFSKSESESMVAKAYVYRKMKGGPEAAEGMVSKKTKFWALHLSMLASLASYHSSTDGATRYSVENFYHGGTTRFSLDNFPGGWRADHNESCPEYIRDIDEIIECFLFLTESESGALFFYRIFENTADLTLYLKQVENTKG